MKRNLIKYPVLLTLFTSLIVFTSCGDNRDTNRSGQSSISVKIETIAGKSKMNMLEFAGVVEGSKKVKLSTKLMGNVSYLPFDAGAAIKKGEVLVKIQSKDIEAKKQQVIANLNAAKAAHSNMERNFNRVKSLYEKGSATEKEFEDVTLGYKMTEAQVKAVSEMKKEIEDVLSYSVIRAPFDGFIVNKFVQAGDIAAPGYPLLIVENFNSFNVVANVSSDNINKVQKGNEVELEIDALNNKKVLGEILEVNPGAHPASKQYSIKVKINPDDETKKQIKSGMYARVLVGQKVDQKILINKDYLVKRGQLAGVFTVNRNNEAVLRWLRLGKEFGKEFEVLSGLTVGEKVIITKNVQEGQRVEVK